MGIIEEGEGMQNSSGGRRDTERWWERILKFGLVGYREQVDSTQEIQRHGSEENRVTAKGFKHVVKKDTRSAGKKWFKVYRAKEIRGYRYVV